MTYYPIMLDLTGKHILVVGGGKVAERRIKGLLETKATITVISPKVTGLIKELSAEGRIQWKKKRFETADLSGAFYIISATNDKEVSETIKQAAPPHQLLNLADNPEESNVALPSVIRRGRLILTVSTSGASPKLAKQISRQLAQTFDESYEPYLDFLFKWRERIKKEIRDSQVKEKLLSRLLEEDLFNHPEREKIFSTLFHQLQNDIKNRQSND
ncbi:MAG TPA: NAD(P)-binding protein [Chondromyces sp.]|nr:NAD(P)-binding protein [Chondromyces sp.]